MKTYISNKKHLIRVICRTQQWSGVNEAQILKWLDNFSDDEGKYIGLRLFLYSLYYSEMNLIYLLKHSIYDLIIGQEIKRKQIENKNIFTIRSILESNVKTEINKTLFVPLLDNNNPSESGNAIARYLTNSLNISNNNVKFHFDIKTEDIQKYNRIIILDDTLGSGQHISRFWNGEGNSLGVKKVFSSTNIPVYFCALVGYEKAKYSLAIEGKTEGLQIVIGSQLSDDNRVLQPKHRTWNNADEWIFAEQYLKDICGRKGLNLSGYHNLDFAVFIHNTAPDWSLPIFWQSIESEWNNLVNRKNSI